MENNKQAQEEKPLDNIGKVNALTKEEVNLTKKVTFLQKWFAPMRNKKPRKDNKFFGFMQQLGGTFMLPVAVLSIAGVFLGIGSGLQSVVTQEVSLIGYNILGFIGVIGQFFFDLLGLSFTIAIVVGLASNNAGSAAFAAVLSYFGTLAGMNFMINILPENVYSVIFNSAGVDAEKIKLVKSMFGFPKVMDLSILGAILNGVIVWRLHEFFQYKQLPTAFSFFGGKRLAPSLALIVFPIMGMSLTFLWPWVAKGLYWMGVGFTYLGNFGPGLFIFTSRLLCPTGLHHMLNALFSQTAVGGSWTINPIDGGDAIVVQGTLKAMQAFLANGQMLPPELSRWMTGSYILPIFFGLPAAAIAIYAAANKDQRPVIKGAIISGILATAVGGVTETIEFLFLFIAPWLYIFHALMVGVGYVVFAFAKARIGLGGELPTWIIYGPVQGLGTRWWLALICGPIWSFIYFNVFYFSIKKFDIKTIGRSKEIKTNALMNNFVGDALKAPIKKDKKGIKAKAKRSEEVMAEKILDLIGGWNNIEKLTNCFSRLRITFNQPIELTDEQVKAVGAVGLIKISNVSYQIVCGAQVESVRNFMERKRG